MHCLSRTRVSAPSRRCFSAPPKTQPRPGALKTALTACFLSVVAGCRSIPPAPKSSSSSASLQQLSTASAAMPPKREADLPRISPMEQQFLLRLNGEPTTLSFKISSGVFRRSAGGEQYGLRLEAHLDDQHSWLTFFSRNDFECNTRGAAVQMLVWLHVVELQQKDPPPQISQIIALIDPLVGK